MTALPRIRFRTMIFVGVNFFALLLIYLMFLQPVIGLIRSQRDELGIKTMELERYRALERQESAVREILVAAEGDGNAQIFLSGESEGGASAVLQALVKQASQSAGLQVRSVASLPAIAEGPVRYLGTLIDIGGPIGAIHQLLGTIEHSASPALFIRSFTIRAPAEAGGELKTEPALNATIAIYGAVRAHTETP